MITICKVKLGGERTGRMGQNEISYVFIPIVILACTNNFVSKLSISSYTFGT